MKNDWDASLADLDAFLQKEIVPAPTSPPVLEPFDDSFVPDGLLGRHSATGSASLAIGTAQPPAKMRRRAAGTFVPLLLLLAVAGWAGYLYLVSHLPLAAPVGESTTSASPAPALNEVAANPVSTAPEVPPPDVPEPPGASTAPVTPRQTPPAEIVPPVHAAPASPAASISPASTASAAKAPTAPPEISGEWTLAMRVEPGGQSGADNLNADFEVRFTQADNRITGTGRKVRESSGAIPAAQMPVSLEGTIQGDRALLTFTEHAPQRLTQGKLVLIVNDTRTMRGRFSTPAAESFGTVEAHRVMP